VLLVPTKRRSGTFDSGALKSAKPSVCALVPAHPTSNACSAIDATAAVIPRATTTPPLADEGDALATDESLASEFMVAAFVVWKFMERLLRRPAGGLSTREGVWLSV
jgi:hypothetical protein